LIHLMIISENLFPSAILLVYYWSGNRWIKTSAQYQSYPSNKKVDAKSID
jgi:hypothetical protein